MAERSRSSSDPGAANLGGESPCYAHLIADAGTDPDEDAEPLGLIVDLDAIAAADAAGDGTTDGAIWHLPHGGDLDANLVRLGPGRGMAPHVNDEVDVLWVVRRGDGLVHAGRRAWPVAAGSLVLIDRGASWSVSAGPDGMEMLSVHRRRAPLGIARHRRA